MKIYLAGKVDEERGAWRDVILGKVHDYDLHQDHPKWELLNHGGDFYDQAGHSSTPFLSWPTEPNTYVLGLHDYVGPYRLTYPSAQSKHSGYFHGVVWSGQHGMMEGHQQQVVQECIRAMSRADFIFAYLNSPDCFGTLAEIGMAHAMGKYVALVVDDQAHWEWRDYWFIEEIVSVSDRTDRNVWDPETRDFKPQDEATFIKERFRDALVQWTARKPERALAVVPANREQAYIDEFVRYGSSFRQIEQWTSDPRVRAEAAKMVARVRQAVGR